MTSDEPTEVDTGLRLWWVLAAAGLVGVAVGSGLGGTTALAPTTSALVALLTVVVPVVALAQAGSLEGLNLSRLEIYGSSMASIAILCLLALADGFFNLGAGEMRLVAEFRASHLWVGVGLGMGCVAVIWAFVEVAERMFGIREPEFVRRLLPHAAREKQVFLVLSIFAGVGEEIVYRGFLLTAVALWSGSIMVALAVSSLAFGLVHSYQAGPGILRTGLLGWLLGACVVVTNSLIPAIVAHTLIDWVMGLWLGPRILGVGAAEETCARTHAGGIDPDREGF